MRTILVANRKGGVGKTLIAVNLAAAFAQRGERVAIADADRQRSALGWVERRPDTVPRIRSIDWTQASSIGEHPKKLDWLIIDAPGALKGSKAEALISNARAVLTPVQPSFFDETATRGFLEDIEDLKRIRKGKVRVHLVANRSRAQSRAAKALEGFFSEMGQRPIAWLTDRAVYGELAASGMGIFDRELKSLAPIKEQWTPIFNSI